MSTARASAAARVLARLSASCDFAFGVGLAVRFARADEGVGASSAMGSAVVANLCHGVPMCRRELLCALLAPRPPKERKASRATDFCRYGGYGYTKSAIYQLPFQHPRYIHWPGHHDIWAARVHRLLVEARPARPTAHRLTRCYRSPSCHRHRRCQSAGRCSRPPTGQARTQRRSARAPRGEPRWRRRR